MKTTKSTKKATSKSPKKSSVKKNAKTKTAASSGKHKTLQTKAKKSLPKKNKPVKSKTTHSTNKGKVVKTVTKKVSTGISVQKKKKKTLSQREKKINDIRMSLIMQKSALLEEAEVALNELPGQTVFPDLGDQATAETDRNFMLRLRGREQRLLKKIDEALERIDNGTFGICDDCGEEIDVKRLEARPVTTMCIECKTLQEEEEKLRAS